jgi:hypothetical protein
MKDAPSPAADGAAEHAAPNAGEFVDVVDVQLPGSGYLVVLTFSTGEMRLIDMEPYLFGPAFEPLRDPALFAQVTVDPEQGTIVWPNGAHLSPDELYTRSIPIAPAPTRRGRRPTWSEDQERRLAAHRTDLLATGWLTLTELAARRGEEDVSAVGAAAAAELLDQALIVVPAPDRSLVVPAFQLTAAGHPRPELRPLLKKLLAARIDGWAAWTWLTSPSNLLAGDVPERVAASAPDRAMRAAADFAAATDA